MNALGSFKIIEAPVVLSRAHPTNILTIDLEDWYQGLEIPCTEWAKFEDRLEQITSRLLELLAESGTKATFFVLGKIAEAKPDLVRMVANAGHEIGTHGHTHSLIYKMTPKEFAEELERSVKLLEDITGRPVLGHRAAYFSISEQSLWALDIIAEQGLKYDSSIYPIRHYRYHWSDTPRHPYILENATSRLVEIPVSTLSILGHNLPMFGGFYLRFFPRAIVGKGVSLLNRQGHPVVIYLHPWELDPKQPKISLPYRLRFPHYWRLGSTRGKLRSLLRKFKFGPACAILPALKNANPVIGAEPLTAH
jgi:polysaccharide deacetylase family protein (PEP-CTERM system associated)